VAFGRKGALIRRNRKGAFEIHLQAWERDLLGSLVTQLRDLLTAGAGGGEAQAAVDPSLTRLFPTAYPDDVERDAEYQSLVRDDLLERRLTALDVMDETLDADIITEAHLTTWMGVVNDLRLVLGTRLDVSEEMDEVDPDDPDAPLYAAYHYLAWLLENIVEALAGW